MKKTSVYTATCALLLSACSAALFGGVADFVRANELKTAFMSGLPARAAATAIGGALAPVIFDQIDKLITAPAFNNSTNNTANGTIAAPVTQEQSFVRTLLSTLTGVDISIALWLAPQMVYQYLAQHKAGEPQTKLFDLSYGSGMDTCLFITAFISAYEAVQKLYEVYPALAAPASVNAIGDGVNCTAQLPVVAGQSSAQVHVLATAFLTAGIVAWATFELGAKIAGKIVSKDSTDKKYILPTLLSNWILFNVGVGLIVAIEKLFFAIGDYFDFTKDCNACRAVYKAGSDFAYVVSYPVGILAGYWTLYKALHPKLKPA